MLQRDTISAPTAEVPLHGARTRRLRRGAQAAVGRLTDSDRRVLGMWAGAHVALAVIAWFSAWIGGGHSVYRALLGGYGQWDYTWFQGIAAHGYFSGHSAGPNACAFLPGDPLALAAVHLLVRNWIAAGLLVSLIAGGVALVCVGRLGGERAALYVLAAPAAMYLMVGYSEALFLALALPAWMAAKRRDWAVAALLATFAGLVRVNGLFLIAALVLAALTTERGSKRLRAAALVSAAILGPVLCEVYFWSGTNSWTAWLTANRAGWGLRFVGPWQSWKNTWSRAFGPGLPPDRAAMFQLEIACMLVALALTLVLTWRRAWPEALYCGLAVAALGTTSYYQAAPRAVLIMWPLYVLIAKAAERRPWIGQLYLWACAPLAAIVAVYFFLGLWAV